MQHLIIDDADVLGDAAFSAEELAVACGVTVGWVHTHVAAGVLTAGTTPDGRFACATLVRARRIASLETGFDADPQLAALAADLMEEVAQLRRRLRALGHTA